MDERSNVVESERELLVHAENAMLPFVPDAFAGDGVPFPRTHIARGEGQAATLFALAQLLGRIVELRGPFGDTVLELLVELLELTRLAVKLGEDPDLGAQNFRDHRHRNVVDRAQLIAAQPIDIREIDGGDEDDRRLLETWVLADHRRQLEAVELGHADVYEDDSDLGLEQVLQRFPRRSGGQQVLAQ